MSHPGLTKEGMSQAIGLARISLIIGLVFLHYGNFPGSLATPFDGMDTQAHHFATWLNSTILFFFFSAVPLLSMVSGWLFFSFPAEGAGNSLRIRIRRRFVSLYLPLVVWNALYFTGFYAIYLHNPEASLFSSAQRLGIHFPTATAMDYVNAVFGVTSYPISFQFWFVRDLFVTVLVTPLFWLALRYAPWPAAALFGAIWLYGYDMEIFTRPDVPFFFYMGALLHTKHLPLAVPAKTTVALMVLYITLAGLRAAAPYVVDFSGETNPLWLDMATRAMRIPGVIASWGVIYRLAQMPWGRYLAGFGGLAFFLHSAHWPLLAIVKKGVAKIIPTGSDIGMLAHYGASVIITIALCLAAGLFLARFLPKVFAFTNGGRYLRQHS